MKRKYIVWSLVLILLVAGYYGYLEFNRERSDSKSLEPKFTIDAKELLQEFETNEQQANKKYNGQDIIIAVTGVIKEIFKSENGYYTIVLGDVNSLSSVRCAMDTSYSSGLNQLQPGNVATVKGNFNGYKADELGIGADIELNFGVLTTPSATSN